MNGLDAGTILADRFALVEQVDTDGPVRRWIADDQVLRERVTLVIPDAPPDADGSDADDVRDRIRQACRETRRLAHPHILAVYDVHEDAELCFISREYRVGTDATSLVGRPVFEIVRALLPIIEALDYAHGKAVVHGALEASCLIGDAADDWCLADFGITRMIGTADNLPFAGPRDDVAALGRLLQSLTGGTAAPAELTRTVERMVRPSLDRPLDTMSAVRDALAPFAEPPTADAPLTPADRPSTERHAAPIEPVSFQVAIPSTDAPQPAVRGGLTLWIFAALAVLVGAVLGVFLYLPDWVASRRARTEPAATATDQFRAAAETMTQATTANVAPPALADETKRLLVNLITTYDRLGDRGAEQWASADFHKAKELRLQGENVLQTTDHDQAAALLQEALETLRSIEQRQPEILAATLEEGNAALDNGAQAEAQHQFALALQIDPESTEGASGAERAARLDEVLALTRAAGEAEQAGDLAGARKGFADAAELDPLWTPATVGLARLDAALAGAAYTREMALALEAVAAGKLADAETAYRGALHARPDSKEARAGLSHVQQRRRSERIAYHRRQADAAERDEDWATAIQQYRAVLALDGEIAFAKTGLERSQERERLTTRMASLIDNPEQLFDPRALAEAQELTRAAAQAGSPRLDVQRGQLSTLVKQASTPVTVVLESDGDTEITIQRVGQLGTFQRREVLLLPGTYVAIGIRDGYRDVRQQITVGPGSAPPSLRIACSEKI
jgi:hypothetical protein